MSSNAACIIADITDMITDITDTISDTITDIIADITDIITDISLAANVHGQHYAIWLDRLFERGGLCVSPICCLTKYIEAAACP